MTKKNSRTESKKTAVPFQEQTELSRLLLAGNYFFARKLAKTVQRKAETDADRAFADYALRKTAPDSIALLVGFLSLLASAIVALVTAY